MELAQLIAFTEVARAGSFTRAAEALYLTQPSVTSRIQTLEREVGGRLLERTSGAIRLTDAGRAFLPYARIAINAVRDGTDALRAVHEGNLGSLYVAAVAGETSAMLAGVFKRFRAAHPGVTVHLSSSPSGEIVSRLLEGEIHVGICRLTRHPRLDAVLFYDFDLSLAVGRGHHFLERESVTLAEVMNEPFISFEEGSYLHRLVHDLCLKAGVRLEPAMVLNSTTAMVEMVAAGIGVAFLPTQTLLQEVALGRLHRVEVQELEGQERLPVGVHTLNDRTLPPVGREFIAMLGSSVAVEAASHHTRM
jgi:DNA-binding transcriptional LysR family regulator